MSDLSHPKYRPDIDGLRAVAVLSVVAFHAFPRHVTGGFTGVDVFFVISGFLISTIIIENLQRGTFRFSQFYARRICRIFPALIVVLAASYAFGWLALLPDEYQQLGKHMAAAAGFVSNFVLWQEGGYFDKAADTKPLLHLWSLGIEEQFYIIWPALVWLSWRRKAVLLGMMVAAAGASFFLGATGTGQEALAVFYSPQTRFWELLAGSMLAAMRVLKQGALAHLFSVAGIILLLFSFCYISKDIGFFGAWLAVPVLGAVLLIAAGPQAWGNRVLLSNRLAVWIGLISYPLYLWHWPLLSFAAIVESGEPILKIRLYAIGIAVVLSWLTYIMIEKPVRFGPKRKAKVAALIALMAAMGGIGYFTYRMEGLKSRASIQAIDQVFQDSFYPIETRYADGSCEKLFGFARLVGVVCQSNSDKPEILFIGDSHAMALNSAAYYGRMNLKTMLIGVHGCLPLIGYAMNENDAPREGCSYLLGEIDRILSDIPSIRTIVIATRGPVYFTGVGYGGEGKMPWTIVDPKGGSQTQAEMFYDGLTAFVARVTVTRKKVVFVLDVPELGESSRFCFERPFTITQKTRWNCTVEKEKVLARQAEYRAIIDKIKIDNPSLNLYDSLDVLCDDSTCYGMRDGRVLYWDDDHISVNASEIILNDMLSKQLFE